MENNFEWNLIVEDMGEGIKNLSIIIGRRFVKYAELNFPTVNADSIPALKKLIEDLNDALDELQN